MKIKVFLIIICLFYLSGCTSAVTMSMAYVAAKHSDYKQKRDKRYNGADKCFAQKGTMPFDIAEMIFHGHPVPEQYKPILQYIELGIDYANAPPHYYAYGYYYIAKRLGDNRAQFRLNSLKPYMEEREESKIKLVIDKKYLISYLAKCFAVPPKYYVKPSIKSKFF